MALLDELRTKAFPAIMRDSIAYVQSSGSRLIDFSVGSSLRAVLEASAGIGLWMQSELLRVAAASRLSSSSGADAESFVADYGLSRLPAVPAFGNVTFSRFSASQAASVPVGATVRAADLTQDYAVVADPAHPLFSAVSQSYVIPVGTLSASVPVRASVAGAGGNASAGTVSLIGSNIAGIDLVTNPLAMSGGDEAETDEELKGRFPLFISSLAKATRSAVGAAVAGVRQGLSFTVAVNTDEIGNFRPGHFVITVDDGSGAPSPALLSDVTTAVESVRALTETFSVRGPVAVPVDVALTVSTTPGTARAPVLQAVRDAVAAYVASLPVGATLPASRIAAVGYSVSGAVSNVSAITLNNGVGDVSVAAHQRAVLHVLTVS